MLKLAILEIPHLKELCISIGSCGFWPGVSPEAISLSASGISYQKRLPSSRVGKNPNSSVKTDAVHSYPSSDKVRVKSPNGIFYGDGTFFHILAFLSWAYLYATSSNSSPSGSYSIMTCSLSKCL